MEEVIALADEGGITLATHLYEQKERLEGLLSSFFAELSIFWGGSLEAEAIALLVRHVPRAYPFLLVEDIHLFVEQAMHGRFSTCYGALAPHKVMEWLGEYRLWRSEAQEGYYRRKKQALEEAHQCLSREQQLQIQKRIEDYLASHQPRGWTQLSRSDEWTEVHSPSAEK